MERRRFLQLGMVMGGTIVLGGMHRFGRSLASAAGTAIPTVDQLIMTNTVDNIYDIFAKGGKMGDVMVQRTPLPSPMGSAPMLLAEFGLAYHLESVRGAERKEILLDFSLLERSLTNNHQVLKIDPTNADALIISHGHGDHYGALPDLSRTLQGRMKPGLILYAGGEDTFCHRWVVTPDGQKRDLGQLNRPALEAQGLKVVLAKEPTVVAGHAVTSGQIPRLTDFEKPPAAARLEAGPPGSGCEASLHFPPGMLQVEAKPGEFVQDIFWGEHATAYHVKNRGLVIISSCGHAGIINSIRQIQQATGIDKVHAVVGGWHLAPSPEDIVAKTIAAFKEIDPDYLIPMHCTGFNTTMAIQREMPEKLIMPSTGTRVVFVHNDHILYLFPWRHMPVWCLWGISVLLLALSWGWAHEGTRLAPATMVRQRIEGRAPELALVNQFGQPLTLMELQGKVVLLTFTYSSCAEVCPLITAAMVTLQQRLTAVERQQIFFLSVTAQPEVDTPVVLHAYAHHLGVDLASWAFLTGHPQAVQAVWQAFGLTVKPRTKGVVDHPAWTLLIDRKGMVQYRYLGSFLEVETILEDIRTLW